MFKKIVKKIKAKVKKTPNTKRKKDIFDISARDLGRATKKLAKRVVVKCIRDW